MVAANSRSKRSTNPLIPARLGPLTWTVPSATTRGVSYEVKADVVTGELRCNCPARRVCWHVKACAAGAMGKPHIRVRPQAPVPTRPQPAGALSDAKLYRD